MGYPYKPPAGNKQATVFFTDVGAVSSVFFCPGFTGRIKRMNCTVNAAVTGADTILTTKIGTVTVTNGGMTIPLAGAAAGNIATATPSALNVFQATDFIRVDSDGGASNSVAGTINMELEPV